MRKNELMYSRFHTLQVRTKNCKHDFWSCYIAWCAPPRPLCALQHAIRPTVPTHLHPWRGSPAAPLLSLRPLEATRGRWQGRGTPAKPPCLLFDRELCTYSYCLAGRFSFFLYYSFTPLNGRKKKKWEKPMFPPARWIAQKEKLSTKH